jgi:hypothetical protein
VQKRTPYLQRYGVLFILLTADCSAKTYAVPEKERPPYYLKYGVHLQRYGVLIVLRLRRKCPALSGVAPAWTVKVNSWRGESGKFWYGVLLVHVLFVWCWV